MSTSAPCHLIIDISGMYWDGNHGLTRRARSREVKLSAGIAQSSRPSRLRVRFWYRGGTVSREAAKVMSDF
jgi:hypothetical protein